MSCTFFSQQLVRSFSYQVLTPSNLAQLLAGVFVTALGASFLTSTVVRYVILPENHRDEEHHKRQFWFHNQMMHNFCTVFLVIEILLTSPQLEFVYMLFGILIGLAYAHLHSHLQRLEEATIAIHSSIQD